MTRAPSAMGLPADPAPTDAGAAHLIALLTARLMTGHSATAVLEAWCVERGFAGAPPLRARSLDGGAKALTPIQRDRLAIGSDEPVRYRRVRLDFGGHVLSEAENWYVPSRLTPAMNAILDATETPFGHVVQALAPTRRNLALRIVRPDDGTWPGPDTALFAIEAVLSNAQGVPVCEVAETYLGAVLRGGAPLG